MTPAANRFHLPGNSLTSTDQLITDYRFSDEGGSSLE
jgi:hypothetical protein